MDGHPLSRSPSDLYSRLGIASAPLVVDVRAPDAFAADDRMIIGAIRRAPEEVERWRRELAPRWPVVAYCAHGEDLSQKIAAALRAAGIEAGYLDGGMYAWNAGRLPTRRKRDGAENKWVTRERPKIDRIACPWLVSRFINPQAEFLYVPANDVARIANEIGGTPYDIKGVAFGHVGERCSFDAIIAAYDIHDAALARLATIVRGADTSRPDLTPQCEGLLAMSYGLSVNFTDDRDMLAHGLVMYDALYAWCRLTQAKPG